MYNESTHHHHHHQRQQSAVSNRAQVAAAQNSFLTSLLSSSSSSIQGDTRAKTQQNVNDTLARSLVYLVVLCQQTNTYSQLNFINFVACKNIVNIGTKS